MRKNILLAVALFLSACQFNLAIAASPGGSGFSATPAFPNKVNPGQFTVEMKPGTSATESLQVSNNYTDDTVLYVNGIDSTKAKDGTIAFKTSDEKQTDAGTWIKFNESPITVKAKSKQNYEFTINVPTTAKPGDYLAGIEVLSKGSTPTELNHNKDMVVTINTRFVDKVNIKVTDTPQPIEKMTLPPAPTFFTPTRIYLIVSASLFLLVLGFFGVKALKNKKTKKHAAAQGHTHETTPEHDEPKSEHHKK